MSIEGKKSVGKDYLKKVVLGTAIMTGGLAGIDSGIKKGLEEINTHILTPAAMQELKNETGASDPDIAKLEAMLKPLLLQELERMRQNPR
jgi:hypothetical protein